MFLSWAGYAAIGIFIAAYILFAWKEEKKTWVAAGCSLLGLGVVAVASMQGVALSASLSACTLFGYYPHGSPWHLCGAPGGFIEWDTLGLLLGLFLLAALLNRLKVFQYVAIRLADWSDGRPYHLFLVMSFLSFALSAFINSITVMVVLATITIEVARALGTSPVNLLLAEISCSNVGGAATFVGDPPNVILGTYFGLGFDQFLVYAAPLALGSLVVTLLGFGLLHRREAKEFEARGLTEKLAEERKVAVELPPLPQLDRTRVALAVGAFAGTIGLLAVNIYIPPSVGEIGLIGALLALLVAGRSGWKELLKGLDWATLGFFFFLFLLVGILDLTGVIGAVAQGLGSIGGRNVLLLASVMLWSLGLLSSVVDNVPLAAAAAPIIAHISATPGGPPVGAMVYATAVGTDVGGNGTPIGASANVVGLAVARKAGVNVSWGTYIVRAFPVMVGGLAAANIVLLFWH
ncbi:MAG: hypothetical protein KGJ23_11595 [Euryarchaeota archaeon]|nr:hypothetical protein [Euryarchaeota archaeon]MDE1837239.1 hypothetical protein [Euryarchaeota archaeon]MDE1879850.1 hypothetical protein [Euryarchaeota archaeon]MDE2045157.1 hypothetical protein [Thermoplasmata archaeon]